MPGSRRLGRLAGVTDGRGGIDAALVTRLVAAQFPEFADLPVRPAPVEGWDNRTYRLGDDLSVRLPSAEGYVAAVAKENRWLPWLAPHLAVAIPSIVGAGVPSPEFDRPWSIRRWLPGETASARTVPDPIGFAVEVAEFIRQLQRISSVDGPTAGEHSFYRGCSPAAYDDEARAALDRWSDRIDVDRARSVWSAALGSPYEDGPLWFHGDIAHGNLLLQQGKLSAVIDFGTSGVGDPACDLVIAWTFFTGPARRRFRAEVQQDDGRWARARGWALWKALISLTGKAESDVENLRIVDDVLAEAE